MVSSANKQGHKAIFYPGSGPRRVIPYVLLVCIAFDGVLQLARSLLLKRAKAIEGYGYGCLWLVLYGCLSWPYIDGQVSRSRPCRSTIERKISFLILNFPCELRIPVRYAYTFDTANNSGLQRGFDFLQFVITLMGRTRGTKVW